ncbi:MAG: hypothetical protein JWN75_257 [Candidatus Saccharibacteria bacterium]|nr:hypothetical protein [Candidatus Saccharibacteria bacterium]
MTLVIVTEDVPANHSDERGVFDVEVYAFATNAPIMFVDDEIRDFVRSATINTLTMADTIIVTVPWASSRVSGYADRVRTRIKEKLHPHFVAPMLRAEEALKRAADRERLEDLE